MNLTSLFAVSLYNYSKSVNSSAVEYLILAALIYFMFFLAHSGMTMLCGNAVQQLKAVTSSYFRCMGKKTKIELLELNTLPNNADNQITFSYNEFREPLIMVSD